MDPPPPPGAPSAAPLAASVLPRYVTDAFENRWHDRRVNTHPLHPAGFTRQCSHDTAADNLVVKLPKAPEREWGSLPTPTKVAEVASTIDKIIGGGGVAPAARDEKGEGGGSAPGYEGKVPAATPSPKDIRNMAFALD